MPTVPGPRRRSACKKRRPPRERAGRASSIGRLEVTWTERARVPGQDLEGEALVSVANDARFAGDVLDRCRGELAFAPANAHLEASARAEPLHGAVRPRTRKRRQELDVPGVTLQEHLRNRGSSTEIAVDLKRRMGVEEVRVRARGRQQ